MQFHGRLNKSGTTRSIDAALLIAKPEQLDDQGQIGDQGQLDDQEQVGGALYLACADGGDVINVTINDVIPAIQGGDVRLVLSSGDVFHLAPARDGESYEILEGFYPKPALRESRLARLETVGWRGMIALAIVFLGLVMGFRAAIAPLGDIAAGMVPEAFVEKGSRLVLAELDLTLLKDSALPDETRIKILADFNQLIAGGPREFADTRLHFRSSPKIGPNAFALPGKDIIILDELVEFADDHDVVLGVLAHEFGHVTNRHSLRQIMRSAVIAFGVSIIVGADDSILEEVVAFGSVLVHSEQSRQFEREADRESTNWMRAIGRDPSALTRFFEKISKECGDYCGDDTIFSSHPAFKDRIQALTDQTSN
jgi:Zn-dependent protease with chaperone function